VRGILVEAKGVAALGMNVQNTYCDWKVPAAAAFASRKNVQVQVQVQTQKLDKVNETALSA